MKARICIALMVSVSLSGCVGTIGRMNNQIALAERGVLPDFNKKSVERSTTTLNDVLASFEKRADSSDTVKLGSNSANNFQVFLAGADYIDEQCDGYLEALESYNKYLERGKGYVGNAATATDVILAAASASTKAIGITAASFGLVSDSIEVTKNTLLTDIEPSALRGLVTDQQAKYVADVRLNQHLLISRPATTRAIRGYLRTCLPSSMRSLVNEAVKTATVDVQNGVTVVQ